MELRCVFHFVKGANGALTGTMDSIDQPGANGLAISSITLKGSQLALTLDVVHGSYEGTVNAEGTAIHGTWSQGQSLTLDLTRFTAPMNAENKPAKPSDIDGAWTGTLDAGARKMHLIFHFANASNGLTASMDSLDEGVKGIPATVVTRADSALTLEFKQMGAKFAGKIAGDLNTIEGKWLQGTAAIPLKVTRAKEGASLERRRPQNPVKPYPYREEDVSYPNKSAGITLAGTLTIPPGHGPFPAVFLITGSGAQDRDEALLGHRPFLVLADHLTRQGLVVLRADDRGTAKSGGVFATATTADFAIDAEAAVAYLKTRAEVNPDKIGLIGHSEGGVIAPMVAARNRDIAFIVLMAGSAVRGDEIVVAQTELIAEANGMPHAKAVETGERERAVLELVETEKDPAVLERELRQKLQFEVPEAQIGAQVKTLNSPWFRYFIEYDPAPALAEVRCAVLAISGSKDLQVPPQLNVPVIRKALLAGGNKDFEVVELPGLNHLFQTAQTGSPSEYAEIEETIAPLALDKMSAWILKHVETR
jgi:hypothetical protein